ncbi:MAG TPA: bifunctional 4-hydroxy-2-oxoglutarate aldolase/2-dehydro-3-deoxy-phosphogluconate aldolase [Marmoricola sp.]|nr:bifunctional 4-hydroxy-2-oxoglutarate aldolase/2-dehydro-3-deoxy-phosphogluconate aldolase [Marmoricola sp.]
MTHVTPASTQQRALRSALAEQGVVAVVRASKIPDATALCDALRRGGIRVVELTFTTPGVEQNLASAVEHAASDAGSCTLVGAGTVTEPDHARAAVDAGAAFLVTPGIPPAAEEIARIASAAGVPLMFGALTPSEVMRAVDLGSDVVKIFPASLGGPRLISDLRGPFPDVPLVPSGGVTADNARQFLDAGALAVSVGTSVVAPAAVADGSWEVVEQAAREFRRRVTGNS